MEGVVGGLKGLLRGVGDSVFGIWSVYLLVRRLVGVILAPRTEQIGYKIVHLPINAPHVFFQ